MTHSTITELKDLYKALIIISGVIIMFSFVFVGFPAMYNFIFQPHLLTSNQVESAMQWFITLFIATLILAIKKGRLICGL